MRIIKDSPYGKTVYIDTGYVETNEAMVSNHVFMGNTRIASIVKHKDEPQPATYYFATDHLGSSSVLTNNTGAYHERIEYLPYGEVWVEDQANTNGYTTTYKFTGKELDKETGLYYFGARYYDARIGRWISTDPALEKYFPKPNDYDTEHDFYWYILNDASGKLPGMGGVYNAVNLDVYHYAGQNPVKLVDPDGNYMIIRPIYFNDFPKWEIKFYSDEERKFLNKIRYLPASSLILRFLAENNPFSDFYYDSSISNSSVALGTLLDIAGSINAFGKIVNYIGTVGGLMNTYFGNISDEKQDKYRQEFIKFAGIDDKKYMTSCYRDKLKLFMDAIDVSIAYYFDKVKGTNNDKGFENYAKSMSERIKNVWNKLNNE